jgi:hypothetical protein
MKFSETTKRLTLVFLAAATVVAGKYVVDLLAETPGTATPATTTRLRAAYDEVCTPLETGKDTVRCSRGLYLMVTIFSDMVEAEIYKTAPLPFDSKDPEIENKKMLQDLWKARSCSGMMYADSMQDLARDANICLDVAVKVADYFGADKEHLYSETADELKALLKDAAKKAPHPNMILV